MTQSYNITLKINDMKQLKVGSHQTEFYLVAYSQLEVQVTTKSRNIIMEDATFLFESDEPIDKIEVWSYEGRSLIGSLHIKGTLKPKKYSHVFKKYNLFIEVLGNNSGNEPAKRKPLRSKVSKSSTFQSSSEEEDI